MDTFLLILAGVLLLTGLFLAAGFKKIPSRPPHKGILTEWGARKPVVINEGWNFFIPIKQNFMPVKVEQIPQEIKDQKVRTPDIAELIVPISVTWIPDKKDGQALIDYINSGGENGVKIQLEYILEERLREWAISPEEGPQTWEEALAAREEATAVLLKAIADLEPINCAIPTPALLKYFNVPQKKPNVLEIELWGKNWEKVDTILNSLPLTEQTRIKTAINKRRSDLKNARRGSGDFKKPEFGIVIQRLSIGEIKIAGKLAEVAELKVKEERDSVTEAVELEHVAKEITKLTDKGFSNEQALEIIQTERGKIKKDIHESKLNISQETRATIEKILPNFFKLIFKERSE